MSRKFSRFKYAEEFAHELDHAGRLFVMHNAPPETTIEDDETYSVPVYVVIDVGPLTADAAIGALPPIETAALNALDSVLENVDLETAVVLALRQAGFSIRRTEA